MYGSEDLFRDGKETCMNKYDLYIGKSIMCCCGSNCRKRYEVISNVYENDCGEEVFDIKGEDGYSETVDIDYINEYTEY